MFERKIDEKHNHLKKNGEPFIFFKFPSFGRRGLVLFTHLEFPLELYGLFLLNLLLSYISLTTCEIN